MIATSRWDTHRVLVAGIAVAAALACATGCGSPNTQPIAMTATIQSSATIWFQPLPSPASWPVIGGIDSGPGFGSLDFLGLFQENAQWPKALARTQAFGMYSSWVVPASDQDLQTAVSFLNANNIGIEIEAPAMQALSTCGSGLEGYVPYPQTVETFTLDYLQRLQALGAQVTFIKVDEPYYFGNVWSDPRSCHFSVEEIATQIGQYVQLVHTVYPNAVVGDVEPIIASAYTPNVVTAMGQWHATYQSVTGAPFPFFFADIDFSNPQWPSLVKSLEVATKQSGTKFGIIYIGDPADTSDAEWSGKAVARFQIYQGQNGGQPDYVFFQSWETHPQYCLPESDPTTFTGVIDAYIDATN